MATDFSLRPGGMAGPVTLYERLLLSAVYFPYLTLPLFLVYHMLTSSDYASGRQLQYKQD